MSVLSRDYGLKIISGGQTGADLAGLRAAQSLGLLTGGTAPKGYRTLKGLKPQLAGFGLVEHQKTNYQGRTHANVVDADATVIIAKNLSSPGTKLTINVCAEAKKPCFILHVDITGRGCRLIDPAAADNIAKTLSTAIRGKLLATPREQFVINVAGNSSASAPGMFMAAFMMTVQLLSKLEAALSENDPVSDAFQKRVAMLMQPHVPAQLDDVFEYIPELDPRREALVITS